MRFILITFITGFLTIGCGDSSTAPNTPMPIENIVDLTIDNAVGFEQNDETLLTFQVSASENVITPVVIDFATTGGTATADLDYIQSVGQVTIEAGQRFATFQITVLPDDINEVDEQVEVTITTDQANIIGNGTATGSIADNDDPVFEEDGYRTANSFTGYSLVWEDEFNGTELDMDSYTFEMGDGCPNLCGWGNNELQVYRGAPDNTKVEDGKLVITAQQESDSEFTSSRIITRDKREFRFGRIDIRAKLPEGQGIWPAIWMLGANINEVGWPASGEIDIMELVGHVPNESHGTAHWGNSGDPSTFRGNSIVLNEKFSERYHVFSLVWERNSLDWYVDETKIHSLTSATVNATWRFNEPFFFIFNVAVGGNWPGNPDASTVFPQQLEIDYIRVFQ